MKKTRKFALLKIKKIKKLEEKKISAKKKHVLQTFAILDFYISISYSSLSKLLFSVFSLVFLHIREFSNNTMCYKYPSNSETYQFILLFYNY